MNESKETGVIPACYTVTTTADAKHHTMVLGVSGLGKSVLLQEVARKRGITYEELLQQMEPTEEQKAQQVARKEEKDRVENQRLKAVREAFWNNTSPDNSDFTQLHSVLVVSEIVKEPTEDQVKAFFMMLPAEIIGSALSWGFSDTVVREQTYEFVEENKQAILKALSATSA